MKNLIKRFMQEESGATMVEYALLVALISVAAVAVLILLGPLIANAFQIVLNAMPAAIAAP